MTSPMTVQNPELRKNLRIACEALLDKKAMDLKLLYFGDTSPLTDCFIVATGTSDPHLKASGQHDVVRFGLNEAPCRFHHARH